MSEARYPNGYTIEQHLDALKSDPDYADFVARQANLGAPWEPSGGPAPAAEDTPAPDPLATATAYLEAALGSNEPVRPRRREANPNPTPEDVGLGGGLGRGYSAPTTTDAAWDAVVGGRSRWPFG